MCLLRVKFRRDGELRIIVRLTILRYCSYSSNILIMFGQEVIQSSSFKEHGKLHWWKKETKEFIKEEN
jgi:hypothetical protein